jgi:hypothetical protein
MDLAILTEGNEGNEGNEEERSLANGFWHLPFFVAFVRFCKKQHDCRVFTFDADLVGKICRP